MPKAGEIDYLKKLGRFDGFIEYAAHKPFSDPERGGLLMRFAAVLQLLPPPPARIIDMGCGTGWTSRFLANSGYRVVGVDICADMIEVAERQRGGPGMENLTFLVRDYESLDFGEEFDAVVFFDSLHHAEDERLALRKTYESLVPGGACVTSEPGEGHAAQPHSIHAVEGFGVTEKDMPPHHIFRLSREIGFRTMKAYPMPEPNLIVPYHSESAPAPRAWWKRMIVRAIPRRHHLTFASFLRLIRHTRFIGRIQTQSAICRLVK
jgi:2-polyprenyl-3-methyl-5-hydroxy-6-metoxy-1,4-benzoquinol methylase